MLSDRSSRAFRRIVVGVLVLSPAAVVPLGAAGPAPLSQGETAVEQLSREVLDRSQPEIWRIQVLGTLGTWATPEVRAPLIALLADPSVTIRGGAARALGWPGNREAVPALRERVEAPDEVPPVRAAAIESLRKIGDPSVRDLLLSATRDVDPGVRGAALGGVALGPLTDAADRTELLSRLAEDGPVDLQLRAEAIRALAATPEASVGPVLMRILANGPRAKIMPPPAAATQRDVMVLRYAQQRDLRAWAAKGLGDRRERAAVPLLLQAAEEGDDYFLRLVSVDALGMLAMPEAVPVLLRRLEDPFPLIRGAALVALVRLGQREEAVLQAVTARLADETGDVRAQAVLTLAVLGDASMRPRLEALRQTELEPAVQRALEVALSKLPR